MQSTSAVCWKSIWVGHCSAFTNIDVWLCRCVLFAVSIFVDLKLLARVRVRLNKSNSGSLQVAVYHLVLDVRSGRD